MASMIGEHIKISIFGQSHGEAIGVVIDGLPAGEAIDREALAAFLARRAPGKSPLATGRREADAAKILSGLDGDTTCGAPLCAVIENRNARSGDYEALRDTPRPGHADYTAHLRYGGHNDARGGGHFSGRLTAPLCIAGGIALQILARRGITVGAHILSIADVKDTPFPDIELTPDMLLTPGKKEFPVRDDAAGAAMKACIAAAADAGDSVGGIIECAVLGMPAGIGDPMFGGVENRLSAMVFGIPAVKGVEFGAGFAASAMRGSEHNDAFVLRAGEIRTETNRHGGILGGITSGMPILFRCALKPTPSIFKAQKTVSLSAMRETMLVIEGRHDPCIVPRAVPCVEAAAAIVMLDMIS